MWTRAYPENVQRHTSDEQPESPGYLAASVAGH